MMPTTLEFDVSLRATPGAAQVEAGARDAVAVGGSSELGSATGPWTPEHLLLASVSASFWTTYQVLARRRGLAIRQLTCHARGSVRKNWPRLESVRLAVDVDVAPEDRPLASALVQEAEQTCAIGQSLRLPMRIEAVVTTTPAIGDAAPASA